jgi:hypothetical protein
MTSASASASHLVPCRERDFLDQDAPLRGQKYVCLSFLSPEDVILDKNVYMAHKFLGNISADIGDLLTNLGAKFAEVAEVQDMMRALRDRYSYLHDEAAMQAQFEAYKAANAGLEDEYARDHDFQTSIRGIKVRGAYDTLPEAENRVKQIAKFDDKFDVYIGEVGCWCPWSPHPDEITDSVYSETQLNTLMKAYHENVAKKDELHMLRKEYFVDEAKRKVENAKLVQVIAEEEEHADPPAVTEITLEESLQS